MIDLTNLRHGDTITVLPKKTDVSSKPWTATVGDVIIDADGVPGVWTAEQRWVPAHRIAGTVEEACWKACGPVEPGESIRIHSHKCPLKAVSVRALKIAEES